MTTKIDSSSGPELTRSSRTRVRLPESKVATRLFQGWGPAV
jgi:hypothetical protein